MNMWQWAFFPQYFHCLWLWENATWAWPICERPKICNIHQCESTEYSGNQLISINPIIQHSIQLYAYNTLRVISFCHFGINSDKCTVNLLLLAMVTLNDRNLWYALRWWLFEVSIDLFETSGRSNCSVFSHRNTMAHS